MLKFDFNKLQERDFKEDSVREFIIMPLLRLLGFDEKNLILSKKLTTKTRIGSNKEIELRTFPDYTLLLVSRIVCLMLKHTMNPYKHKVRMKGRYCTMLSMQR